MANGTNFLVVDQSNESQALWKETLVAAFPECGVELCSSGEGALELAKSRKFSAIIASWELSPMTCLVFMQKLRELPKNTHSPFLIFAGRLSDRDAALAREFDIPDVLLAPFEETKVQKKINEMLEAEKDLDPTLRNLRKIEAWLIEKRVNEALSLVTSCLKKGPYAARAHCLYGDIWMLTGKYEQAEKAYKNAQNFDPEYSRAISGIGKCYLKMNKFQEAMSVFESLHKKIPGNLSRLVTMGNAYLDNGDNEKAREIFDKAKEIDSSSKEAAEGLGKIEFNEGNIEVASRLFRESGKGDELASYYNGMAIALVSQGKYDDALKLYNDALTAVPKNSKESLLYFNIGLALKKSDRFSEAVSAFSKSLLSDPGYTKALSGLVACARKAESKGETFDKKLADEAIKAHKEFKHNEKIAS